MKLARAHYRIRCIRQDALHKLTSYLTENYAGIAIEDLNVHRTSSLWRGRLWLQPTLERNRPRRSRNLGVILPLW